MKGYGDQNSHWVDYKTILKEENVTLIENTVKRRSLSICF